MYLKESMQFNNRSFHTVSYCTVSNCILYLIIVSHPSRYRSFTASSGSELLNLWIYLDIR